MPISATPSDSPVLLSNDNTGSFSHPDKERETESCDISRDFCLLSLVQVRVVRKCFVKNEKFERKKK